MTVPSVMKSLVPISQFEKPVADQLVDLPLARRENGDGMFGRSAPNSSLSTRASSPARAHVGRLLARGGMPSRASSSSGLPRYAATNRSTRVRHQCRPTSRSSCVSHRQPFALRRRSRRLPQRGHASRSLCRRLTLRSPRAISPLRAVRVSRVPDLARRGPLPASHEPTARDLEVRSRTPHSRVPPGRGSAFDSQRRSVVRTRRCIVVDSRAASSRREMGVHESSQPSERYREHRVRVGKRWIDAELAGVLQSKQRLFMSVLIERTQAPVHTRRRTGTSIGQTDRRRASQARRRVVPRSELRISPNRSPRPNFLSAIRTNSNRSDRSAVASRRSRRSCASSISRADAAIS